MYFSAKRQQFLIDQGYSFKVITNLLELSEDADLHYSTQAEQLKLLSSVLSKGQEVGMVESLVDADELHPTQAPVSTRTEGNIQKLTGSYGHRYLEVPVGEGRRRHGKRKPMQKMNEPSRRLKKLIFE